MKNIHELIIEEAYRIWKAYPGQIGADRNVNSILTGRLGFSFFLLELYKRTGSPDVRRDLQEELNSLEDINQQRPTNNYSLLRGKGGLALLYLELFTHTGEEAFLKKATGILGEYYEGSFYKYGIVSDYSLSSGIAGILLLSVHLYLHTKASWLADPIEKLLLKLVYASRSCSRGVYWGGITDMEEKNMGLTTGAAGIAFVFRELGKCYDNRWLRGLAEKAEKYEAHFWESHGKVGDYGAMGIKAAGAWRDEAALGIFSGKAGMGLTLIETWRSSGEESYLQEAEEMAGQFLSLSGEQAKGISPTMNGWWGIGYFLLRLIAPSREEPRMLVFPRLGKLADPEVLPAHSIFRPGNPTILRVLIERDFKVTSNILNEQLPESFQAFFDSNAGKGPEDFVPYVREIVAGGQDFPKKNIFLFHFEREIFGLSIKDALKEPIAGDDETILNTDRLLSLPEVDFWQLKLVQSDKVCLFSKEDALKGDMIFTKEAFGEFLKGYGGRTVYYRVTDLDELQASFMGIIKLVFDRFATVTSIYAAHQWVEEFLFRQDGEVLQILEDRYGVKGPQQLREAFKVQFLDGVCYSMAAGILVNAAAVPPN